MKTVAVVECPLNPVRPSYFVARYPSRKDIRVVPVNLTAGSAVCETVHATPVRHSV
jgi:predicted CoA-binding protein